MVGDADVETDAELEADWVSLRVGLGLVVGVVLQDPVSVAVRDVEGETVVDVDGLVVIVAVSVVVALGLVEEVAETEGLVLVVGDGLGEGQTAHSLPEIVVSSQRLY